MTGRSEVLSSYNTMNETTQSNHHGGTQSQSEAARNKDRQKSSLSFGSDDSASTLAAHNKYRQSKRNYNLISGETVQGVTSIRSPINARAVSFKIAERQFAIPRKTQPLIPKSAPKLLETIPEMPRHAPAGKKLKSQSVVINPEPARIDKVEEKVAVDAVTDGEQRIYRIDSSAKVTLRLTVPSGDQHGPLTPLMPPLFYEPLKLLSGGIRLGNYYSLEMKGVNRRIHHLFDCDVDFPSATQVVIVRFARYTSSDMSGVRDVNPDNLRIMCNGKDVLKVDNVNYSIEAHVPLVGAPIEIQRDLLHPTLNVLVVVYTVRENNSPEDFLMFVELTRRRPTEDLVREVQQRRLTVDAGALRAFKILSLGEKDGIESCSSIVSLKCPLSQLKLEVPVRGRKCRHIECFSAASYIGLNKVRKPKWACPKCNAFVPFEDLILDEWMIDVLSFTSLPTVHIVSGKNQLVLREKKARKPLKLLINNGMAVGSNLNDTIILSE